MFTRSMICASFFVAAASASCVGFSAEIYRSQNEILIINGEISSGDARKFKSILLEDAVRFLRTSSIEINSQGGSISEAIEIAKLVESARLNVEVPQQAQCSSACFIVLASGAVRIVEGSVLLHRPYLPKDVHKEASIDFAAAAQGQATGVMLRYLQEQGVPANLLKRIERTPSSKGYRLGTADLVEFGMFAPKWQEILIARCDFADFDFGVGIASKDQVECSFGVAAEARVELLTKLASPEIAREAMRQFLLESGGIEGKGGKISFNGSPDEASPSTKTPSHKSISIPNIDIVWDEYAKKARAKGVAISDPVDSVERLNVLYRELLPALAKRGDSSAAFRLGMLAQGFGQNDRADRKSVV